MGDNANYSALIWLKGVLEESLTKAGSALETYVEESDDEADLKRCVDEIHQVYSALQIAEIYGAALVAEEIELVLYGLIEDQISKRDEAIEVLTGAIIQLPDYLGRLEAGQKDVPLALLPLLNDLRAARNTHLVTEGALFSPNMSSAALTGPVSSEQVNPQLPEIAKRLRHAYHKGLLGWFRNQETEASLELLKKVIGQLEASSSLTPVVSLWQIAKTLVDVLHHDGVESSVALKLIMGQLDRQLKRLIDQGEVALAEDPLWELYKNILFYIASSTYSSPLIDEVKTRFHLDAALPDNEQTQSNFAAPNADIMSTVAVAIKEDLVSIKDRLDMFMRGSMDASSELHDLAEPLRKIGDTLGMLGQGLLRKKVLHQVDVLGMLKEHGADIGEERLMEMAGDLLYIESSIDGLQAKKFDPTGQKVPGFDEVVDEDEFVIPEGEYQEVLNATLQEITNNISAIKDFILTHLDTQGDQSALAQVQQKFGDIAGAFYMLQLLKASALTRGLMGAVETHLMDARQPSEATLDHLANAITAIEYYIEGVNNYRFSDVFMLSVTEDNLTQIGQTIEDIVKPEVAVETTPKAVVDAPAVIKAPAIVTPPPVVNDTPAVVKPVQSVVEKIQPTTPAPLLEDIDEEILEIFMEEANEELAAVQENYPKWRDQRDEEALSTIRRSFHTLKGSGRLVGAVVIGEFAWAIENLLNRLIEGSIPSGPQLIQVMNDAVDVLPVLVECQEKGVQPSVDFGAISARAEILCKPGGEAQLAKTTAEPEPEPIAVAEPVPSVVDVAPEPEVVDITPDLVADVAVAKAVIEMDAELYDIFTAETSSHLQAIQNFLDICEDTDGCQCDESLIRSIHTLHGSAHMASVTQMAMVSAELEKLIKAMLAKQTEAGSGFVALLSEATHVIEQIIASINHAEVVFPDHESMIKKIQAELVRVEQSIDAPAIEAPVDLTAGLSLNLEIPIETTPEPEPTPVAPSEAVVEEEPEALDEELLEIFLEESSDIMDDMEHTIQKWTKTPEDAGLIADLQRSLHTLKGGARLSGLPMIGDVSHSLESLLTGIGNRTIPINDAVVNLAHRAVDDLEKMLGIVAKRQLPDAGTELLELIDDALAGRLVEEFEPDVEEDIDASEADIEEPVEAAAVDQTPAPAPASVAEAQPAKPPAAGNRSQEVVKIRSDLLDTLVNYAGEISIYRSRLEQQNSSFLFNLTELDQTVARLRTQLRNLEIETEAQMLFRYDKEQEEVEEDTEEFDPLEMDRFSKMQQLSRSLMESVTDLISIQEMMSNLSRESETLLLQQARVNTELQEGLMRTRMVPFSSMVPKLNRLVRQTCKQLDKKAELEVIGAAGEMDRTILERMIAPLEHMIRNSIAHGIEMHALRLERSKPSAGKITLQLTREGTDIVLYVADDGGGISVEMVRKKALEKGLIQADQTDLSEEDILQFILESGFSTTQEVSQISGRGVGMDVVNSEIKQLGGSLHIDSQKGHGTLFTIRLPFTLAINQALLVQIAEETYAIPHSSIEGVVRLSRDELERCYSGEKTEYEYASNHYHVQYIGALLGTGRAVLQEKKRWFPVLLVRTGQHRIALQVDAILGNREIVVKSVGPQVSTVNWVSGATIMGDGRVVLILDVSALVRHGTMQTPEDVPVEVEAPETTTTTVMVVDDSITVRKVTTRLLERNEMNVFTAKDGVDAIQVLQEQIPDVMLLDVEMPRMDGYELARHIRNSDRLKHIPIIMITSRTGEKHRQRAMEIGVNTYLGKPYQEAELLENIHALVGK